MTETTARKMVKTVKIAMVMLVLSGLLAGCSGFNVSENPNTDSDDETGQTTTIGPTYTPTSTPTLTSVSSPTSHNSPDPNKSQKYTVFLDGYIDGLQKEGIVISNSSSDPINDSISITYEMEDPDNNSTISMERKNISFGYSAGVEYYTSDNQSQRDESWVPKRVNINAISTDGRLYETAYITYDLAIKWVNGEISDKEYLLEYYSTIEIGPANPAAESD
ncbi:hypothetical protein OB920_08475 [Halobacteria archaeon HArc-gm2]|nr:hypothetical protein [Halobacteria archaeon HArc-gm2]